MQPDLEKSSHNGNETSAATPPQDEKHSSAFKALGWLDRLLALWIILAMALGILLANFVPNTQEALEQGTFVGVSVPIGESATLTAATPADLVQPSACWS